MSERPRAEAATHDPVTAADIADDQDKSLDPNSVIVARITAAIWLLVLAAPLVIGALLLVLMSEVGPSLLLWLGAGALAYTAFAGWCLYWPSLRYRHASYRVGQLRLWIRRGVLWRYEIAVSKSRVQHTDVSQGPLQRRFDIATLVLHTAGTQNAAVALSGLPYATAVAIRDYLIEGGPSDAV